MPGSGQRTVLSGGGQLTQQPCRFTADGQHVLIPCANVVRAYEYPSSRLVAKLIGHSADVTSVVTVAHSPHTVYTASLDGTICSWNLSTGRLVHHWNVGFPIVSLTVTGDADDQVAHVSCQWNQGTAGRVLYVRLSDGTMLPRRLKLSKAGPLVAAGGLVATWDRRTLFVWTHAAAGVDLPLRLIHTKNFTCVAVDPEAGRVAAGDATGRVLTWHDMHAALQRLGDVSGEAAAPPPTHPCTTMHWHSQPVGDVCFSADGATLLSGGREAVLVQWQLGGGSRQYLPRLGAALQHITACPTGGGLFCVALVNNTVLVVNMATAKVVMSIAGILPEPPSLPPPLPPPCRGLLTMLPAADGAPPHLTLLLPSAQCMLQLYDPMSDSARGGMQTTPRNVVSRTVLDQGLDQHQGLEAQTCYTAAPASGAYLATVDVRPAVGRSTHGASWCLRLWDAGPPGGPPFVLNSTFDDPHGELPVSGCCAHPAASLVATTTTGGGAWDSSQGDDGQLKLWTRVGGRRSADGSATRGDDVRSFWRCSATLGFKGLPMTACCFSDDGSLLAAGCPGLVALWATDDLAPAGRIPLPAADAVPVGLAVVPDTPYLVVASRGQRPLLCVVNLLSLGVVWSLPLEANAMAVDGDHAVVAVATPHQPSRGSTVLVIEAARPAVRYAWRVTGTPVSTLHFLPAATPAGEAGAACCPPDCAPLLVVAADRRYGLAMTSLAGEDAPAAWEGLPLQGAVGDSVVGKLAAAVQGLQGGAAVMRASAVSGNGTKEAEALLDSPSHLLPPMAQLSARYLEALVLRGDK